MVLTPWSNDHKPIILKTGYGSKDICRSSHIDDTGAPVSKIPILIGAVSIIKLQMIDEFDQRRAHCPFAFPVEGPRLPDISGQRTT